MSAEIRTRVRTELDRNGLKVVDLLAPRAGRFDDRADDWAYRALKEDGEPLAVDTAVELLLRLRANGVDPPRRFALEIGKLIDPLDVPVVLIPRGESQTLAAFVIRRLVEAGEISEVKADELRIAVARSLKPLERYGEGPGAKIAAGFELRTGLRSNPDFARERFRDLTMRATSVSKDRTDALGPYTILRHYYEQRIAKQRKDHQ